MGSCWRLSYYREAHRNENSRLPADAADHDPERRAERYANADLSRAAGDGVTQYAVDSHGGQQHGE